MRLRPRVLLPSLGILLATITFTGCDGTQTVSLTAEDFRFVPSLIRVSGTAPLTLLVYNAGREVHEFDSPILLYADRTSRLPEKTESAGTSGMTLRPGQSLRLLLAPPPGTYLYICRRKGHGDMTGTLIVE